MESPPQRESVLQSWLGLDGRGLGFGAVMTVCLVTYELVRKRPPAGWNAAAAQITGVADLQFQAHFYGHVAALVCLALGPLAYLIAVERRSPAELGLGLRGSGGMFKLVGLLFVAALPVLWLAVQHPDVARTYPRLRAAAQDPGMFVLFHVAYGLKWFAWELYFRGTLLFGARRHFGTGAAVVLSTLPYTLVHMGKPIPELYGSFLFGLLLCGITLRARSIWPAVALHWSVNVVLELMLVRW